MSKITDELRAIARRVDQEWMPANAYRIHVAADLLDEAEKALVKALLWTDEEHDVGEWRADALAAYDRIRGEKA